MKRHVRIRGLAALIGGLALLITNISPLRAQNFQTLSGIQNVAYGAALWGDYDGDSDLDIFLSGHTPSPHGFYTDIWENNGSFTALSAGMAATGGHMGGSRSAWGDYDSDGDLDVVVTGNSVAGPGGHLYRNDGGAFTEESLQPGLLVAPQGSSGAWGDFDNDGDLDLLLGGYRPLRILRNNGPGAGGWNFTPLIIEFSHMTFGDCAFGDYDNDGDLDIAVTGYAWNTGNPRLKVFQNNGGVFTPAPGVDLEGLGFSSLAWGDYDNNGFLDLAVIGADADNIKRLRVYYNNGGITISQAVELQALASGSVAWGDYDNDGDLDLLVTGLKNPGGFTEDPVMEVYVNQGSHTFTRDPDAGLTPIFESQAAWGDYDDDGWLDILAAGIDAAGNTTSTIYHNVLTGTANTPPSVPGTITLTSSWKSITATWTPSTDAQTPQTALTYNLLVRDLTTGTLVMSPMADESTGYGWLPQIGNVNHNTTWTVTSLMPGHRYNVCVQAVDGAFARSTFLCSQDVTLPTTGPDVMMADCQSDIGLEPNLQCTDLCYSPAIYVRNAQDGLLPGKDSYQTPIPGQPNWVYVKLKNRGTASLPHGRVHVYWAKASASLAWPEHWVNSYVGSVLHGYVIGSATITSLGAGAYTTVEIPWTTVPDPADFNDPDARHICLLARFVADSDPITTPEGPNVPINTQNNNNIVWKNVTIYEEGDPAAPLDVSNGPGPTQTGIKFHVPDDENETPITEQVEIRVDLGPDIFQRWVEGGQQGVGVTVVSGEPGNTAIWIISPSAEINGINLPADFLSTIRVEFIYPNEIPPEALDVYHWVIDQYDETNDLYLGGEMYEVILRDADPEGNGKRIRGNRNYLSDQFQLAAHPNPTTGATTLTYTLPIETRVTLAIHDANGRLVRTLIDGIEQPAGSHEILWNGETAGGVPVVSGTYFYRMETPRGTVEKRIVIVR